MADPTPPLSKLAPCPFCGCTLVDCDDVTDHDGSGWHVYCPQCFCDGPGMDCKADAIAAWNRRPSPPALEGWPYPDFTLDQIDEAVRANDDISIALRIAILKATEFARLSLSDRGESGTASLRPRELIDKPSDVLPRRR